VSPRKPKPIPISIVPGSETHIRLIHLVAHAVSVGQQLTIALELDESNPVELETLRHDLVHIRDEAVEVLLNLAGISASSRKRRRRKKAAPDDDQRTPEGLLKLASIALNKWEGVAMLHAWTAACCALVGQQDRWQQAISKLDAVVDTELKPEGVDALTTRLMETVRGAFPSITIDPESSL
jgi:hypothetical protein